MASLLVVIAAAAVVVAAAVALTWAGFRNGDWTGAALACALRKDLEKAANDGDHVPPSG